MKVSILQIFYLTMQQNLLAHNKEKEIIENNEKLIKRDMSSDREWTRCIVQILVYMTMYLKIDTDLKSPQENVEDFKNDLLQVLKDHKIVMLKKTKTKTKTVFYANKSQISVALVEDNIILPTISHIESLINNTHNIILEKNTI